MVDDVNDDGQPIDFDPLDNLEDELAGDGVDIGAMEIDFNDPAQLEALRETDPEAYEALVGGYEEGQAAGGIAGLGDKVRNTLGEKGAKLVLGGARLAASGLGIDDGDGADEELGADPLQAALEQSVAQAMQPTDTSEQPTRVVAQEGDSITVTAPMPDNLATNPASIDSPSQVISGDAEQLVNNQTQPQGSAVTDDGVPFDALSDNDHVAEMNKVADEIGQQVQAERAILAEAERNTPFEGELAHNNVPINGIEDVTGFTGINPISDVINNGQASDAEIPANNLTPQNEIASPEPQGDANDLPETGRAAEELSKVASEQAEYWGQYTDLNVNVQTSSIIDNMAQNAINQSDGVTNDGVPYPALTEAERTQEFERLKAEYGADKTLMADINQQAVEQVEQIRINMLQEKTEQALTSDDGLSTTFHGNLNSILSEIANEEGITIGDVVNGDAQRYIEAYQHAIETTAQGLELSSPDLNIGIQPSAEALAAAQAINSTPEISVSDAQQYEWAAEEVDARYDEKLGAAVQAEINDQTTAMMEEIEALKEQGSVIATTEEEIRAQLETGEAYTEIANEVQARLDQLEGAELEQIAHEFVHEHGVTDREFNSAVQAQLSDLVIERMEQKGLKGDDLMDITNSSAAREELMNDPDVMREVYKNVIAQIPQPEIEVQQPAPTITEQKTAPAAPQTPEGEAMRTAEATAPQTSQDTPELILPEMPTPEIEMKTSWSGMAYNAISTVGNFVNDYAVQPVLTAMNDFIMSPANKEGELGSTVELAEANTTPSRTEILEAQEASNSIGDVDKGVLTRAADAAKGLGATIADFGGYHEITTLDINGPSHGAANQEQAKANSNQRV